MGAAGEEAAAGACTSDGQYPKEDRSPLHAACPVHISKVQECHPPIHTCQHYGPGCGGCITVHGLLACFNTAVVQTNDLTHLPPPPAD